MWNQRIKSRKINDFFDRICGFLLRIWLGESHIQIFTISTRIQSSKITSNSQYSQNIHMKYPGNIHNIKNIHNFSEVFDSPSDLTYVSVTRNELIQFRSLSNRKRKKPLRGKKSKFYNWNGLQPIRKPVLNVIFYCIILL